MIQTTASFRCPLCDSLIAEDLFTFNTAVLINDDILECELIHSLCHGCGTIMVSPLPPQHLFDDYYSSTPTYETRAMNKRLEAAQSFIQKHIDSSCNRVFDIGAGTGFFLSLFKKKGWQCRGIEQSQELVKKASIQYDIDLLKGRFEELGQHNPFVETFDLATMAHVLEHVYSLEPVFSQIRKILRRDGYLYIEVPSLEMFAEHSVEAEYLMFTHLWHFNVRSLERVLGLNGFAAVRIEAIVEDDLPIIQALFRKDDKPNLIDRQVITAPAEDIEFSKSCFLAHIRRRDQKRSNAIDKIKRGAQSKRSIVFYGAGEDLYDLMISDPLVFQNIQYDIVDSNSAKWKKTLCGKQIQKPEILLELEHPLVYTTSRVISIQESIRSSIEKLGHKVEVSNLFG